MDDIASALPEELRPKFLGLVNQLVDLTRQVEMARGLLASSQTSQSQTMELRVKEAQKLGEAMAWAKFHKADARMKQDELNRLRNTMDKIERIHRG